MGRFRFSNRASALITATVASTATTITLETGGGAKFPALASGDRFRATLVAATGESEFVDGVGVVGDVVTIERAKEGTAAQTFPSGSRFELRATAGMLESFLQRTGDTMTGPLDMNNNSIKNAVFEGTVQFTHINVQLLRPIDIDPSTPYDAASEMSSIVLPVHASGQRPSYNGRPITNTGMFDGIVFDWFGDVTNVPSHLKLCDGTNGTPDLRGRYIRGWTDTFGVSGYGGVSEWTRPNPASPYGTDWGLAMEGAGGHTPSGAVGGRSLTVAQLPPHDHDMFQVSGSGGTDGPGPLGGGNKKTGVAGSGQPHDHPLTMNPVDHHVHWAHSPPFFVLAKVMFNL